MSENDYPENVDWAKVAEKIGCGFDADTARILHTAYGWTIDANGFLAGLTAGDHYYESTILRVVVDAEGREAADEARDEARYKETEAALRAIAVSDVMTVLRGERDAARAEVARLREVLAEQAKLETLAAWFDAVDATVGRAGNDEVQRDLRKWAAWARKALDAIASPTPAECAEAARLSDALPVNRSDQPDRFPALDECCQLHESVRVIYVVDGFQASLETGDGGREVATAHGESIEAALAALDSALAGKTLADVRGGEGKQPAECAKCVRLRQLLRVVAEKAADGALAEIDRQCGGTHSRQLLHEARGAGIEAATFHAQLDK